MRKVVSTLKSLPKVCKYTPDKKYIVALSSPVENLLKSRPLLRTKTAAYAIFIRATTGSHLTVYVGLAESMMNPTEVTLKRRLCT